MPPVTKMRGRPKGHKLTTVGLPSRKGKAALKPTSFIDLHFSNKQKGMHLFTFSQQTFMPQSTT